MYFKTGYLVTCVAVLSFIEATDDCIKITVNNDEGCSGAIRLVLPEGRQKCKIDSFPLSSINFYLNRREDFKLLEFVYRNESGTKQPLLRIRIRQTNLNLSEERWYHIEMKKESQGTSSSTSRYQVYVNGTCAKQRKKCITITPSADQELVINIRGNLSLYSEQCNPASTIPRTHLTTQPTPSPSTTRTDSTQPTPSPSTTRTDSTQQLQQDDYQWDPFSPPLLYFLGAVGGTLVMLIIITVLVVVARRRRRSTALGRTTETNENRTDGTDGCQNNNTQLPLASSGNPDHCIYEEVHDIRPAMSREMGSAYGERRGSAHDSENSLYATCDKLGLTNHNRGSCHDSINSLYATIDNLDLGPRVEGRPISEHRGSTHDSENSLYATFSNLGFTTQGLTHDSDTSLYATFKAVL
ncbi:hypothetical protein Pcinc_014364 [Petrolisthes cinctipes]|uniref:Uncharacterized protein n=1 Tax=Petrolisthes cinctipes TaxID=88211 RepID=A0AAE1KPB1_PETCI|nr:hypothetical protein Pcinc_014364 [Petrolisthes cinctipes]